MNKSPDQYYEESLQKFDETMSPLIHEATDEIRKEISNAVFRAISDGSIRKNKTRRQLVAFAKENVLGPNSHEHTYRNPELVHEEELMMY